MKDFFLIFDERVSATLVPSNRLAAFHPGRAAELAPFLKKETRMRSG